MNDRDYLNELARKREADAAKEGVTPGQCARLLELAREHREMAQLMFPQRAA